MTAGEDLRRQLGVLRWRVRNRWQQRVARRVARLPGAGGLPWSLWVPLCAPDTASVVREIGRRAGRPLTFLQIGSNDGVTLDPLHDVVRGRGWSGVVVEPMPGPFARLQANYADLPGVRAEQVAIGDEDGDVEIYTLASAEGDPFWAPLISSFDRDVIRSHAFAIPDIDDRLRVETVDSLRLATLVDRLGLSRIDLVHIDAEGTDDRIIHQIPPDAPWAPTFIIYERCHIPPERHDRLAAALRAAGYRRREIWPDEIAFRAGPRDSGA